MLTHQEEDADDEEWNPAKAAGVCLMNLASCCEGDILDHVMGFISQGIDLSQIEKISFFNILGQVLLELFRFLYSTVKTAQSGFLFIKNGLE